MLGLLKMVPGKVATAVMFSYPSRSGERGLFSVASLAAQTFKIITVTLVILITLPVTVTKRKSCCNLSGLSHIVEHKDTRGALDGVP